MTLNVVVAYAAPGVEALVPVQVAAGASVADAVAAAGLVARLGLDGQALAYSIFGRRATAATLVADGDRIELTRPLRVDADTARRQRANATAAARKRPLIKPNP